MAYKGTILQATLLSPCFLQGIPCAYVVSPFASTGPVPLDPRQRTAGRPVTTPHAAS